WQSPIAKFFKENELDDMNRALAAEEGDLLFFMADKPKIVNQVLAELRMELARRLKLVDKSVFEFVWITDFPLLEYDQEEKRYVAIHHPFTAPKSDEIEKLSSDPGSVLSRAYDLVLNGIEIGGGSIRIHQKEIQEKVFSALKIDAAEAEEKYRTHNELLTVTIITTSRGVFVSH
ncbi:MAG: hypothetical protein KKA42_01125, partial [candidate division Zixibacteria bacterium]|nr:hypothetical protein [candidate division Zixibacteria bacterium]